MPDPKSTTENNASDYSMENQKKFLEVTPESQDYNPLLNENAAEKNYHKLNIDAAEIPAAIPEFYISTEKVSAENISHDNEPTAPNPTSANPVDSEPSAFNPQVNDLGKKDKHNAASMAADTAIGAYAFIWSDLLTPMAQFNTKKLNKQIAEGTISNNIRIPIDEDTDVTLKKFTADFNSDVAEALQVTDEFKNEIREPLIRIMEKQGIGMTDEQKVGYEVVKDVAVKTAMVFQIKSSIKEITEDFIERTKIMRQSATPNPASNADHKANPAPTSKPAEPDFVVTPRTAKKDPIIVPATENLNEPEQKVPLQPETIVPKAKEDLLPNFSQKQTIINPGSNPDILNDMEQAAKSGKVVRGNDQKNKTTPSKTSPKPKNK